MSLNLPQEMTNPQHLYEKMNLTAEEKEEALLERKRKKYFHEKHLDYWTEQENKKVKKGHVTNL